MKRNYIKLLFCMATCHVALTALTALAPITTGAQPSQHRSRRMAFVTDTLMVHDPVMAWETTTSRGHAKADTIYYLLSTGHGLQWATSRDRHTWVVQPTPFIEQIPEWTLDSVPGFRTHVWAPDILRWHDRWWLAYSCSTFGKNTSAIGLLSADRLNGQWRDEGCLVASKARRDHWNAIDPCLVADDSDRLWMAWGSFWDGIQIAPLFLNEELRMKNEESATATNGDAAADSSFFILNSSFIQPIARRVALRDTLKAEPNPTSKYAGRNAIEAPFIYKHDGYYYLFVSWDYCCRGAKSNYRVAVGRSRQVNGPYVDRMGKAMTEGGGTLFFEGDHVDYEAAGHCAVYDVPGGETIFICHGYSTHLDGTSILIQKPVHWTADGWPEL